MNDSSQHPQSADIQSPDMTARLAEANTAGNRLAWAGGLLAILWWGGAGFGLFELNRLNPIADQASGLLIVGIGFTILPGLVLVFAGFMARQNKRTHEANILLLQASTRLLSPTQTATDEIQTLADATRHSTAVINHASSVALTSLKETSDAMESERLRAESVGYAMADNARDLTMRLSEERVALETLSRELSEQVTMMGNTLPKQADAMKQATLVASQDVAQADSVFSARIEQMQKASSALATRLMDLDAIARDAANRTETLQATISRIEDRLNQSHKTVEMAERASTLAVDAATETGNALKDAVSAALDSARDANQEIAEKTQFIQETSERAMADLRETGAKAASAAARVQEQSLSIAAQNRPLNSEPAAAAPAPISSRETTKQADSKRSDQGDAPLVRSRKSPSITEVNLKPAAKRPLRTRRVYSDEIDPIEETRPPAQDTDLFDVDTPSSTSTEPETAAPIQPKITSSAPLSDVVFETDDDDAVPPSTPPLELGSESSPILLSQPYATEPAPDKNNTSEHTTEWRDIIADIDEDKPDHAPASSATGQEHVPHMPREATAEELIFRLEDSGIPLPTAFRARDKKKIAVAARKDQQARRRAIRNVAGGEVDRVTVRLSKDKNLLELAQQFVSAEEAEALKALEDTGHSGRHASPRLSAYLLVDTALEPILR